MTSFRLSRTFFESFWRFYRSVAVLSNFFIVSHSRAFVKKFFQLFSFARLPLISDNFWIVTHCLALVNSFLNFFKFLLAAPRISRTAWLEYQTLPHLSTPFSIFFYFFEYLLSQPLIAASAWFSKTHWANRFPGVIMSLFSLFIQYPVHTLILFV